jgi:Predicted nucleotide-binding protein containing TIR-like domain
MSIRFFLSSSSEQLPIAKALEANLAADGFEPTLWSREAHGASQYNLEALLAEARTSDFAVFVFAPDDQVSIRGEVFSVVRDNVLFELGLFIGALGRDRCFIVRSAEGPMRLPSDLDGLTPLTYDHRRSDENVRRSLGPVTTTIAELARKTAVAAASAFTNNDLKLLQACKDLSTPSNQAYKAFGSMPAAWDDALCMRFLRLLEHGLITRIGASEVESTRKGDLLSQARRAP